MRKVIMGMVVAAVVMLVLGNANVSKNAETVPPDLSAISLNVN